MNIDQQFHPNPKMNGLEHIFIQMNLFEKLFHSIHAHLPSLSDLQTCFDDVSKILPHVFLHNIPTNYQLMVDIIHMYY